GWPAALRALPGELHVHGALVHLDLTLDVFQAACDEIGRLGHLCDDTPKSRDHSHESTKARNAAFSCFRGFRVFLLTRCGAGISGRVWDSSAARSCRST